MGDILLLELKQAIRIFRRSPGFVTAVLLTLSVGIGGTTSIFSLVNGLLLRPIPGIDEPGRLAAVRTSERGGSFGVSAYMDYVDFAERSTAFESMAAFKPRRVDASVSGTTEPLDAAMVTSSYFNVLGVSPFLGRYFASEVDQGGGAHPEVVLTDGLWRRWFGTDPDVVGRDVVINGLAYTVIGVTPRNFRGTSLVEVPDLFVPMTMQPNLMPESGYLLERRGWGGIDIVGRLADDVPFAVARADIEAIGARLATEFPGTNDSRRYAVMEFRDAAMPGTARSAVVQMSVLLLAIVAALWLVVCLNVANLFLARSMRRRQELAMRLALGAGRRRVTAQLVLEFMTMALTAGALGMVLAQIVANVVSTVPIPILLDVSIDVRTLLFTSGIAVMSGLLCAVVPAFTMSGTDPRTVASPSQSMGPRRQRWPSRVLIVGQVTLSVVLLFTTGLFVRTFANLTSADAGFDSENLLTAQFSPSLQGYDGPQLADFYQRLADQAASIPGVTAVAMADGLPAAENYGQDSWFFENADERTQPSTLYSATVSTNYFGTLAIPVVEGRVFADGDTAERPLVVMVNEAAARVIESRTNRGAVGQGITIMGPDGPFFEIVGVVGDIRTGRADAAPAMVYASHTQILGLGLGGSGMVVMLKTSRPAESLGPAFRQAAASVDANIAVSNLITMDRFLADLLAVDRLTITVLGVSSALALLLVGVGLYGLLTYLVTQRAREFGIRLALGAHASVLRSIVLREAFTLAAAGVTLGVVGAIGVTRLTAGFLVGVTTADPLSMAASLAIVVGVALTASYVPVRRATRADPVSAMRAQ